MEQPDALLKTLEVATYECGVIGLVQCTLTDYQQSPIFKKNSYGKLKRTRKIKFDEIGHV